MTDVSAEARISPGCTGLYNPEHAARLEAHRGLRARRIPAPRSACSSGTRGARPRRGARGRATTSRCREGAWPIVSASPIPYFPHSQVPREMTRADMDAVIADYVARHAARDRGGFRHARDPRRARLPAGDASSRRSPTAAPMHYGGARESHALPARSVRRRARRVAGRAADVGAHLGRGLAAGRERARGRGRGRAPAQGARLRHRRRLGRPDRGRPATASTAACSRRRSPTASATRSGSPPWRSGTSRRTATSNTILAAGRADLCLLARAHLWDPYWTRHAALRARSCAGVARPVRIAEPVPPPVRVMPGARRAPSGEHAT